ncbi:MAG: enoyl-CoA hydratase/isomerase family protein, partial [Brooklawnia sp.]|nr:enoyl-CoA hydratase/isomerase family protein [Brooklawnia sp.]
MSELLIGAAAGVGTLTLNRPQRINALTRAMVDQLADQLRDWADDDSITRVELRGAGDRGFCAGADVRVLRDAVLAGRVDEALGFLLAEYDLDQLIAEYPKPVAAHLVGISMGGGLGIG